MQWPIPECHAGYENVQSSHLMTIWNIDGGKISISQQLTQTNLPMCSCHMVSWCRLDYTATLGKRVEESRPHGPITQSHAMPCKFVSEHDMARDGIPLDTAICAVWPITADIGRKSRHEISISSAKGITNLQKRTKFNGSTMRNA